MEASPFSHQLTRTSPRWHYGFMRLALKQSCVVQRSLFTAVWIMLASGCARHPPNDTVIMAWENFPMSLDPRLGTDQASQRLLALTHQGLLKRNKRLELVPDGCLAWRWEQPYADLCFDFPSEAKAHQLGNRWFWFSPNQPLRAKDALDSIEALRDATLVSPKAGAFKEEIQSIRIDQEGDLEKLRIHLKAPGPGFPPNLAQGILGIAPSGSRGTLLAGTGPYRVTKVVAEQSLRLEAKTDHMDFCAATGHPQNLEIRLMPDANTRLLALRHGAIQASLNNLPADLLRPGQGFEVRHTPGANLEYVAFQCQHPILKNPKVRFALSLAIDREGMVKGLMGGLAREAWGLFPPELPYGIDARQILSIPSEASARLHRAEALLNEAGYSRRDPKGIRFTLHMSSTPEVSARLKALALQAQWAKLGVALKILPREFGTLLTELGAGKFEVASLRWVGAADPEMLVQVFHSSMIPTRGFNRGRFQDAEVDRLLAASHQALTPETRFALLRQAQIRILELAPYAVLWWPDQIAALAPGVEIDLNGVGDYAGLWRQDDKP